MGEDIWGTINNVGPRLTWKKYNHNYWGAWYLGSHLEFWPTKLKFKYRGNIYVGCAGYEVLMGGREYNPKPTLEKRVVALEEAVFFLMQENA